MITFSRSPMTFVFLAVALAALLTGCDFLGPNFTGI